MSAQKNPAAVALGKLSSPKKAAAARENGKKGGRPKKAENPYLETCPRCGQSVMRYPHPTPHLQAHYDLKLKKWCNVEHGVNFK